VKRVGGLGAARCALLCQAGGPRASNACAARVADASAAAPGSTGVAAGHRISNEGESAAGGFLLGQASASGLCGLHANFAVMATKRGSVLSATRFAE